MKKLIRNFYDDWVTPSKGLILEHKEDPPSTLFAPRAVSFFLGRSSEISVIAFSIATPLGGSLLRTNRQPIPLIVQSQSQSTFDKMANRVPMNFAKP